MSWNIEMAGFSEEWLANYTRRLQSPGTSQSLTIVLPAPPGVNHLFRNVAGKGRVKTAAYLAWRKAASSAISEQIGEAKIVGKYRATLYVSSRVDLDGNIKAPIDLLVSMGVTGDDKLLDELHVYRDVVPGRLKITIERVER